VHPITLIVITAVSLVAAAAVAAHAAVRRMRAATGLPSPLSVMRRHPDARVRQRGSEKVAFIPGQTEGLAFNDLARRCWELMDGEKSLVGIAQVLVREGLTTPRAALAEVRAFARSLKRSLLAMEEAEWRLAHTHTLDLFAGAREAGILEHRPSESLVIHAAQCILSPDGEFEPWRGGWRERRRALKAMRCHERREAGLQKAGAFFQHGWKLCLTGDLEGAELAYVRSSRLAPDWVNPHYQLGYVRLRLRRFHDAALSLGRAEEISPGYFMVREYTELARRLSSGDLAFEAFSLFDRANAAGLENPDITIRLAHRALQISPEFPSARLILARAYQKKELLERALGELNRTIQMNPDTATLCHALLSRGSIFHAQGRTDQALREWEKVIEINGSETASRSALATLGGAARLH
jgi:tetratricopeptide (TPR) repeat protein